jgi:integral membrane sensor domain MASE1
LSSSGPDSTNGSNVRASASMAVLDLLIMGIGAFALSAGIRMLTGNISTATSLWLANGFALGMLLTAPRSRWPLLLFVSALAGAGSAFYLGLPRDTILWVSLFNSLEVLVAAAALTGSIRTATDLTSRGNFLRFLLCAVLLAPAVLVVTIGLFDFLTGRPFTTITARRILIAHALGMAVMTPVVLAMRNGELRQYLKPGTIAESLLTLALLAAVCVLVFFQTTIPLLFLIFPPMMQVAYRGGFVGTAVALLLVEIIGAAATATGHGPIADLQASGRLAGWLHRAAGLRGLAAGLAVSDDRVPGRRQARSSCHRRAAEPAAAADGSLLGCHRSYRSRRAATVCIPCRTRSDRLRTGTFSDADLARLRA